MLVGHRHEGEVLLGFFLTRGGELVDGTGLGGLGGLTTGVGVNLGVEDEDVDVGFIGEDVIDAAVTDIEGPTVAANDPNGLVDEVSLVLEDFLDRFVLAVLDSGNE